MAVPSTFADLSTTPGSNSGLISGATAVGDIDNHLQSVYALIASIYANSGNGWSSAYLPAANPSYTGTLTGGTGIVNLGSGQVYKDASGNVGIGAVPGASYTLDVYKTSNVAARISSAATSTATLHLAGNASLPGTNAAYLQHNASNVLSLMNEASAALIFGTAATERMRIDSSGNVLVGTNATDSTNKLQVAGRIGATGFANTNGAYPAFSASILQGFPTFGFAFNLNVENAGGNSYGVGILTTAGGVQAERMRIDSSGNQINTPSDTPPTLTVNGQMNLTPTSNTNMRISYRGSDGVTRVANITLA
jgi:hypothetical protein